MGGLRGFFSVLAILGLAFGALACSGGDSGDTPDGGSSSIQADLRLVGGEPITMDPALAMDATSASYVVEVFSGLVTLDRDLKIIPDLAESWDISADGTVYTFRIRRDALFHDGRPVTAEDFKYSIERTAELGASGVSTTADAYLGDIIGARDMVRGRADSISGIRVIDSSTLQITIDAAKPYFLAKLTYPTAFVVDKQQVEANPRNWMKKPNATGPYKVQRWDINERIVLEANDRFYMGAPSVKRVLFNLAGGSSLTQYENDEIDAAGISVIDIDRVRSPRDPLNAEYVSGPNLSIGYIGFNVKSPPFDDEKVRQAFAMAINREQIASVIGKDMAPIANSIMMPGLPGYNPDARAPSYNPEMARQLLAESKYRGASGLPSITLSEVGAGATQGDTSQAILEMWKDNLGIDVTIAQSDAASFFDDLDRGRFQMFSIGWIMDYPDPEDIIDLLFYSASRQNNTGYSNPEFDELVLAARTELDVTKRLQLYRDAEKIVLDEAVWIPLFFGRDHYVVKPHVKGMDPTLTIIPRLRYVRIER
jgi:oligopeptide transport system substrate-binding protein